MTEALTPAEQEYVNSGGEKTDGLVSDNAAPTTPAADTPATAEPDKPQGADGASGKSVTPPADRDPDEEEVSDDGRPKNPGQWVRQGALHSERAKRKELQKQLAEITDKYGRLDERLRMFAEAVTPGEPAKTEPEIPDPEKDIFGYVRFLGERLNQVDQRAGQAAQTTDQMRADNNLKSAYIADAQRFAMQPENRDFGNAYSYMLNKRGEQLQLQGYDAQQIPLIIAREEKQLVEREMRAGRSPAHLVYQMAKSFGYQRPAQAAPPPAAAPATNGAAPPAAAVSAELARISAGKNASRSLSNAGGSPAGTMTLETLANMPDKEFAAFARKNPDLVRELAGG